MGSGSERIAKSALTPDNKGLFISDKGESIRRTMYGIGQCTVSNNRVACGIPCCLRYSTWFSELIYRAARIVSFVTVRL